MMLILAWKHLLHLSMVLAWFLYAEVMSYCQDDDNDNEYHWVLPNPIGDWLHPAKNTIGRK
jgi:hypothetical protein